MALQSSSPKDPGPDAVTVTKIPEGITTITLCRPSKRNAVDPPTALKLYNAFLAFEADESQRVAILHGANGTFCAGFDLTSISAPGSSPPRPSAEIAYGAPDSTLPPPPQGRNIGPMGPSRLQPSKPVIAAVAGYAVAGGLELSLIADMRVVEEDAVFGVFCRRWGVPLIDGGTVRLQRLIGLGRAMDMILTGRAVGAQEALSWGLANRVVGKGKALDEATKLARELLNFPQECLRADRRSAYFAAFEARGWEEAMGFEFKHGSDVVGREAVEGAARFRSGEGRHGAFWGGGGGGGEGKAKL